ncbi:MAG: hypothetical protein LW832_08015 [Parachlamydia sp.]|nr:hypothetical protein [Parachlamydia sp.]
MDWNQLDCLKKAPYLDFFARDISASAYGLKKSTWNPSKGSVALIEELKKNGPLFVGGSFGDCSYMDKPFKMRQSIADRDIYAWRAGAKRHPRMISGHSVLLVGAKKLNDKAFVYFIDPKDPSNPNDRSRQKMYMISFTNLTSSICDLHGRTTPDSPLPYAYHGSFNI